MILYCRPIYALLNLYSSQRRAIGFILVNALAKGHVLYLYFTLHRHDEIGQEGIGAARDQLVE